MGFINDFRRGAKRASAATPAQLDQTSREKVRKTKIGIVLFLVGFVLWCALMLWMGSLMQEAEEDGSTPVVVIVFAVLMLVAILVGVIWVWARVARAIDRYLDPGPFDPSIEKFCPKCGSRQIRSRYRCSECGSYMSMKG